MFQVGSDDTDFKNPNAPFTELISLLKRYEISPNSEVKLAYSKDELRSIKMHIENANCALLQGLQNVSIILHGIHTDDNFNDEIAQINFFLLP